MTAEVEPRADVPALTGIRGFAAWLVVLYHIRLSMGAALPPDATAVLAKGYLAVDLFFMLSGFVLWLNYSARIRRDGLATYPRFIARRVARIWPLHAAMLLAAVALALLLMALGRPVDEAWEQIPLHILLVHNWGFTDTLRWNDPSWSISGEFAAYLLFPFLALAVDWRRFAPAALLLLILLLVAVLHFAMQAGGAAILDHNIPRLGILRALIEFGIGTILCALWLHWRDGRRVAVLLGGAAAALFLVFAGPSLPETAVAPLLLAALLFAVAVTADRPGNPLGWRPVYYLGLISYSTYLVHFLLFRVFKMAFVSEAGGMGFGSAASFLLLTFAASVALFHLVERPAQRGLNRLFDRRLKRGAPPSPAVGHGA
jgi:peptidoglycan/LPS O-acetylase OafA/YrhL